MSSRPLVSIITPSYNRKDFIDEAIDSVLAQTYDNWELIIVDDGSTDGTKDHIRHYLEDERIKYFYQENQGQSVARNFALTKAKGSLISFLDSDNLWLAHRLQVMITAKHKNPEYEIIYTNGYTINEQGQRLQQNDMERFSGKIAERLFWDNFVGMNAVLVEKKCFDEMGGMENRRMVADDYRLWLKFAIRYSYLFLNERTYEYRVMEDQISSDKSKRFKSNEETLLYIFNEYKEELDIKAAKHGLSRFYNRKARWLLSVNQFKKGIAAIFLALKYDALWSGPYKTTIMLLITTLIPSKN